MKEMDQSHILPPSGSDVEAQLKMKTWNFIDKSEWPERGPWDNEPDKAQWVDEATGLTCLAVRAHSHWCGYVGVPEGHQAFEQHYDGVDVDVHGGLTFYSHCQQPWKGQEQPHPEARVCHVPEPGEPDNLWWLGFDCAHGGDKRPAITRSIYDIEQQFPLNHRAETYRTLNYVRRETASLAKQLSEMENVTPAGRQI